jgi:predicted nucleic acid-binding Zn ribbon protein
MFCPECGSVIDPAATRCPDCGELVAKQRTRPRLVDVFAWYAALHGIIGTLSVWALAVSGSGQHGFLVPQEVVAALCLPAAIGLWGGEPWGRRLGLLMFITYPAVCVVYLLLQAEDPWLLSSSKDSTRAYFVFFRCLFCAAGVRYLVSRGARAYFGRTVLTQRTLTKS